MTRITRIAGTCLPLSGRDIDTDRVIPARFLRAITFEGLEAGLFADDRAAVRAEGQTHPFDDPRFGGASVLIVNANFGCGSSREHAPQALYRWGIRAIVGESFAEIFFGNSVALGLPCVTVSPEAIAQLMTSADASPGSNVTVDLDARVVTAPGLSVALTMPESARDALLSGQWDSTSLLLDDPAAVARVTARLPYISGY